MNSQYMREILKEDQEIYNGLLEMLQYEKIQVPTIIPGTIIGKTELLLKPDFLEEVHKFLYERNVLNGKDIKEYKHFIPVVNIDFNTKALNIGWTFNGKHISPKFINRQDEFLSSLIIVFNACLTQFTSEPFIGYGDIIDDIIGERYDIIPLDIVRVRKDMKSTKITAVQRAKIEEYLLKGDDE